MKLTVSSVTVSPNSGFTQRIEFDVTDNEEIIKQIEPDEVARLVEVKTFVGYHGRDEILNEIGIDEIKEFLKEYDI